MFAFPLVDDPCEAFGSKLPPRRVSEPGGRGLLSSGSADLMCELRVEGNRETRDSHTAIILR
jgi:hypothetical protein